MSFPVINDENWHEFLPDNVIRSGGLEHRDYSAFPAFYSGVTKQWDLPLIDFKEIPDRINEQQKHKSSLYHIAQRAVAGMSQLPFSDQGQANYCHDDKTEVLTANGWTAWSDYDWTTPLGTVNPMTHAMEFQQPFERHVYEYDGPMIHSTNRRIDFGVTPDHQMYVRRWDEKARTLSSNYSFVRAGDLGWYTGLLHAPSGQIGTEFVEIAIPDDRSYDGDDFLAMLSLIISDGYAGGTEKTKNWVSFCCFHGPWRAKVEALAHRVGFREQPSRPGVWIRYDAGALANWIRENCYVQGEKVNAKAKKLPDFLKSASVRQIKHFLSWYGDQAKNMRGQFYSNSRRIIDDLQELHLRIGKRGTIGRRDPKDSVVAETGQVIHGGESFFLYVAESDRLCLERKKHIETDRYKGLIYCAAVPNHTLITRRNGSVLISSNCWCHSVTNANKLARAASNQPYVPLSAYSIGCQVKNFRNVGGWNGQAVEWAAKNGIATEGTWPNQSWSRKNVNQDMMADAAKYKNVIYYELDPSDDAYEAQYITALVLNMPSPSDFNWWGHSVCGACVVGFDPKDPIRSLETLILNSWQGWGDNGFGKIQGRKAIPNGATVIGGVTATAA